MFPYKGAGAVTSAARAGPDLEAVRDRREGYV
jgi:hypothetical protein